MCFLTPHCGENTESSCQINTNRPCPPCATDSQSANQVFAHSHSGWREGRWQETTPWWSEHTTHYWVHLCSVEVDTPGRLAVNVVLQSLTHRLRFVMLEVKFCHFEHNPIWFNVKWLMTDPRVHWLVKALGVIWFYISLLSPHWAHALVRFRHHN